MSFRHLAYLAGFAAITASLPAHAISPQPEPPASAKMRPLTPYLGGPQPDPPAKVLKRRVAHALARRGFEPPAAP